MGVLKPRPRAIGLKAGAERTLGVAPENGANDTLWGWAFDV